MKDTAPKKKNLKQERKEFQRQREELRLDIKQSLASYMEHQAKRLAEQLGEERGEQIRVVVYGADAIYNHEEDRFYASVYCKFNHAGAELQSANYSLNPNTFKGQFQPTYLPYLIPEIKCEGEFNFITDATREAHDLAWDSFKVLLNLYGDKLDSLRNYVKGEASLAGKEVGAHLYRGEDGLIGVVIQVNSDKQVLLGTAKSDEERPYIDNMATAIEIDALRNVVPKTRAKVAAEEHLFFDYMVGQIFEQLHNRGWETVQTVSNEELPKYVEETVAEALRLIAEIRDDEEMKAKAAEPYDYPITGLRIDSNFLLYYTANDYAIDCADQDALKVLARRTPMRVWVQAEMKLVEQLIEQGIIDQKDTKRPVNPPVKEGYDAPVAEETE